MGVVVGTSCSAAPRPSLFRGVQEPWMTFLYFISQHVCWPASVSDSRTVVCPTLFCFRRVSSDELVPSNCRTPRPSGVAYCRPVSLLACSSPLCLRLAFL
jgi:hypothetical protein